MAFTTLHIEESGAVGTLRLRHAAHNNALNATMLEELASAARWFDARPEVRAVVISGEGRFFCPGADLLDPPIAGALPASGQDWLARREHAQLGLRTLEAIEGMRAVTIGAAHGAAVGGGLLLLMACDFRLVEEGTKLQLPEIELGLPLAWGGLPRLVAEIGPLRAKELIMSGRMLPPDEAVKIGLVNRVCPEGSLLAEAHALAQSLAKKPVVPMVITKEHIRAVSAQASGRAFGFLDGDVQMGLIKDPEMMAAALARTKP